MRYVTAKEMKGIDSQTITHGISASKLMENAGMAVFTEIKNRFRPCPAIILCGYGNNGGDGLVVARVLKKNGYDVKVFFVGHPKSLSPETNEHLERMLTQGIHPQTIISEDDISGIFRSIPKDAIIVDAIFGIGLRSPLESFYIKIITAINNSKLPVVSIDIPSGLDADTGRSAGAVVKAVVTVTFGYPKIGFKDPGAKEFLGDLVIADIGLYDPTVDDKTLSIEESLKTIMLRTGAKGRIMPGHPWIYRHQIRKTDVALKPGQIVDVIDTDKKFVGRGYYNPRSEIIIRILSFGKDAITKEFFLKRIANAFEKRKAILDKTNAVRVVFSEADALPGLIVDLYNDTVVFQTVTLGMEKFKDILVDCIKEAVSPKYIYEKNDTPFRKKEGMETIEKWWGAAGPTVVEIFEGKAKFLVDIAKGHKTGFYLDQRKVRMALGSFCKGKKILDLFTYTGAFAINAALAGASHVKGVDTKEDWLVLARQNAELNDCSDRVEFIRSDAFRALEDLAASGEMFDVLIVDPPSFLRTKESLAQASKGYRELNRAAIRLLTPGGMLATFTCSHNMPNETFYGILKQSCIDLNKRLSILKRCHQSEDHPIVRGIPETDYLKGYFLKIDQAEPK